MEKTKTENLIQRLLQQKETMTEDDVLAVSEGGVAYIVYSALTDPKNAEEIEALSEPTVKGITLFGKV